MTLSLLSNRDSIEVNCCMYSAARLASGSSSLSGQARKLAAMSRTLYVRCKPFTSILNGELLFKRKKADGQYPLFSTIPIAVVISITQFLLVKPVRLRAVVVVQLLIDPGADFVARGGWHVY